MKLFCNKNLLVAILFALPLGCVDYATVASKVIVPPCIFCTVTSSKGFIIDTADHKKGKIKESELDITAQSGHIILNGVSMECQELCIAPVEGKITCLGKKYTNPLVVSSHGNTVSIMPYVFAQKVKTNKKLISDEKQIQEVDSKKHNYTVRVLLDMQQASTTWKLKSAKGFTAFDVLAESAKDSYLNKELKIFVKGRLIWLNDKPYTGNIIHIVPDRGRTTFGGNEYQGAILVVRDKNKAYLINALNLEDYVFSVLHTETWPGWPLEVIKACVIAIRTYAIAIVLGASGRPFHIRNTNAHQTYSGFHNNALFKEAVEQTKGIFLAYKKRPIIAMYDACCGGIIPSRMHGAVDFNKAPYLARSYACNYCKSSKMYAWQSSYSLAKLYEFIDQSFPYLKRLRDIKIIKKDAAGIVEKLSLRGVHGSAIISGKKLHSLLKGGLKSGSYSIHRHDNVIRFDGRGNGHQLGLCQWGAREMVRNGADYKSVLRFYYPGTTFMHLR